MNVSAVGGRSHSSIVIAVNPMPRLYIESLASELLKYGHVQVLTFYRSKLFDETLTDRLKILGVELVQYEFSGRIKEYLQLRKAASLLREWLSNPGTEVFHCQPNHFLTNYVTFGRPMRAGVTVNLIPDGVANFYETKTGPYERAMLGKKVIAPFLGLSFTPYNGNYLALSTASYGSYWYFGDAGIMADYLPLHRFSNPTPPSSVTSQEGTLFLGQPSSGTSGFDDRYDDLLITVAGAYALPTYKPHPAEQLDATRRAQLHSLGYSILETNLPAEQVTSSYANVIGIASSVLFNIRLLDWNDEVLCVSDPAALEDLTGRDKSEIATILQGARRLGIKPLAAQN